MITFTYKERYKRILQKNEISEEEVKQFEEAIKQFTSINPEWKKRCCKTTLTGGKKVPVLPEVHINTY